jgi:hypothetical protein
MQCTDSRAALGRYNVMVYVAISMVLHAARRAGQRPARRRHMRQQEAAHLAGQHTEPDGLQPLLQVLPVAL